MSEPVYVIRSLDEPDIWVIPNRLKPTHAVLEIAEFERLKADAERGEWMIARAWFPAAFEDEDFMTIDPHNPTNSENGRDAARQAIDALRAAAETGGNDA